MNPTLSICVITYNHASYIRECLQSIVSQVVDFPIEIIVGDDCSTDGTTAIVEEYVAAYPHVVRAIKHAPNVGGTQNMFSVHNAASGEFLAHIDGDDCMLPGKLQQQVMFLREHPDHALVAHDVEVIDDQSRVIARTFGSGSVPRSSTVDYLVSHGCYFAHSSKMYRRSASKTRNRDRPTVDLFFHIEQALSGLIGYIDKPLGQYRRAGSGLSSIGGVHKRAVLQGHLDAYEYALQSGVRPEVVLPALLRFRYVNAMGCLRAQRPDEFRLLASPSDNELRWATLRQRIVFAMPAAVLLWGVQLFDGAKRLFGKSR